MAVRYLAKAKLGLESGSVRNGYEDIAQLGVDRWAAIVGAYTHFGSAVCIVDAGTAVTVDLVRDGGRHLGGLIVPGLQLMRSSLEQDTEDIERFSKKSSEPAAGAPSCPATWSITRSRSRGRNGTAGSASMRNARAPRARISWRATPTRTP